MRSAPLALRGALALTAVFAARFALAEGKTGGSFYRETTARQTGPYADAPVTDVVVLVNGGVANVRSVTSGDAGRLAPGAALPWSNCRVL